MRSTLMVMVAALSTMIVVSSCSTDPNAEPRLEMQTEMNSSMVVAGERSGTVDGFRTIDSIRINRARILISRIKLHTAEDDTADNKGRDVKVGPAVIDFTKDKVSTVFATAIPVGRYEKIKLEMHKFSGSEADTYTADPIFGPFAFPERITLIVDGTVYANGLAVGDTFTWTDDQTKNLWIKFDPFVEITASSTTTVVLNFDPVVAFRSGGSLLDPKRSDKKDELRLRLWSALFMRRK